MFLLSSGFVAQAARLSLACPFALVYFSRRHFSFVTPSRPILHFLCISIALCCEASVVVCGHVDSYFHQPALML